MSKIKLLVVGPLKSGKSTVANIIGDLSEGLPDYYRPTVGCRIVELERDPPPAIASFGKKWYKPLRWGFYYLIILAILHFTGKEQQFIYFQ